MIWFQPEPTLQEILSDPITQAIMQADRVDPHALTRMLQGVTRARRRALVDARSSEAIQDC